MSQKILKIAIIGGGINGLACGVNILENLNTAVEVTIISEYFTPNTTGDISAGFWGPCKLGSTEISKINKWSKGMHNFLHNLWLSKDAAEAGVCLLPVISVTTDPEGFKHHWRDIVYGYTELNQVQLAKLNENRSHGNRFLYGVNFVTYTSEPIKLLPYLHRKFQEAGGKILEKKISNFDAFASSSNYDVFINCTGLGSKKLFNDNDMYPIRGQVSRVKADWLYYAFLDKSGKYIIPNFDSVVLGGTAQIDDYSTVVSQQDKSSIINSCQTYVPGLKMVPLIKDVVGLRPGRVQLRIETELLDNGKLLIHNYGHGGSGVTTSWGCATDVTDIVKNIYKSKL